MTSNDSDNYPDVGEPTSLSPALLEWIAGVNEIAFWRDYGLIFDFHDGGNNTVDQLLDVQPADFRDDAAQNIFERFNNLHLDDSSDSSESSSDDSNEVNLALFACNSFLIIFLFLLY